MPYRAIGAGPDRGLGSVGEEETDAAAAKHVAFDANHAEIGRRCVELLFLVAGLDVEHAETESAGAAGEPAADIERNLVIPVQSDPAAVEQDRRGVAAADEPAAKIAADAVNRHAAEGERALVLQEEVAFLREEQIEPREVDLLFVGLHLGEVGVDRQVGDQALRDRVLHVEAGLGLRMVRDLRRHKPIGRQVGDRVRLDVQVGAAARRLDPDERGCEHRSLKSRLSGRRRHARQRRDLVLRPLHAHRIEAPHLRRARLIPQRLERHRGLDGPAAIEASGLGLPHGIPIAAVLPIVHHRPVGSAAERVHRERERGAPVVEGVEDERDEIVALPAAGAVAPHLGGDQRVHVGVPHLERHIDMVLVKGDPCFGAFGGRLAAVGLDLDEIRDRTDVAIERLVECAVDAQRLADPHRTQGRATLSVAGDDLRRDRLGWRVYVKRHAS